MTQFGQPEIVTQECVIAFFRDTLSYVYLGNWKDRPDNGNLEKEAAHCMADAAGVQRQDYRKGDVRAAKSRVTLGGSRTLYDANRDVYNLLRYGVKVQPDVGEHNSHRLADRLGEPRQQRFCHRRGGHGHWRKYRSGRTL